MANELQRYASAALVKSGDSNLNTSQAVGSTMVKAGGGALAVYTAAAILPLISFVPLMLVLLVVGGYLRYFRG